MVLPLPNYASLHRSPFLPALTIALSPSFHPVIILVTYLVHFLFLSTGSCFFRLSILLVFCALSWPTLALLVFGFFLDLLLSDVRPFSGRCASYSQD